VHLLKLIHTISDNLFLTCFLICFVQLYDIRSMKELESFRGHNKDVTG
jgi:hypothetical protein